MMLPLWTKGLTEEMVQLAEHELGENCENRTKALKEFKSLIEGERGFRPLRDDAFLTRFLRHKKYDVGRAFRTFKNYYAYKARYSGWITDLLPSDLLHVLEMGVVFISPKRTPNGEGVIMSFPPDESRTPTLDEHLAALILAGEIGMDQDATQVCGCSIIMDLGMDAAQLIRYCHPQHVARLVRGVQSCWPYRLKSIHLVNAPIFFDRIFNWIKPVLTKKVRERIHFHGEDLNSLYKHFSPEILPSRLAGELGEKEYKEFHMKILENTSLMKQINTYTYQKKKYPKSTDNPDLNINERTDNLFNDL